MQDKASHGVEVRLCVGGNVGPPPAIEGAAVRRSVYAGMISIYRFDDVMLVWQNRGAPGLDYLGPVLHLRRVEDNGLFDAYELDPLPRTDAVW